METVAEAERKARHEAERSAAAAQASLEATKSRVDDLERAKAEAREEAKACGSKLAKLGGYAGADQIDH